MGNIERANRALETAVELCDRKVENDYRNDIVTRVDDIVHSSVCSRCEMRVNGFRFICMTCPCYILCEVCVKSPSKYSDHDFLQVPSKKWVSDRVDMLGH